MTTLRTILNTIDNETPNAIIKDGANDWDAYNLLSETDEEVLDREAATDENGNICFVDESGYMISPAVFRVLATEAVA